MRLLSAEGWNSLAVDGCGAMEVEPDQRDLCDYVVNLCRESGLRVRGTLWLPSEALVILMTERGGHAYIRVPARNYPGEAAQCLLELPVCEVIMTKRYVWGGDRAVEVQALRQAVNAIAVCEET